MSQKGKNAGPGCLILFGLPFASAGLVMLFLMAWSIFDYARMQSWRETPAQIVNVDLEHGDDTERVVAEYSYQYEGQQFTGTRVAINSMSDNIGNFQSQKHAELQRYKSKKKPFPCFVNPSDPSESILYRELRWELLALFTVFSLVFGGVGFGIIFGAFWSRSKLRDQADREFAHPDEPWLWRPDWAAGYAEGDNRTATIALMVFGVIWNLISWPVALLAVPKEWADGNYWVLLMLLFPLIGLGIGVACILAAMRWRKYGRSRFQIASPPGVIGGALAGAIVAKNLDQATEFQQTLTCSRQRRGSDSGQSKVSLWQTDRIIQKKMPTGEPGMSAVPVLFHIPYDCQESSTGDGGVTWELEMRAQAPGVNYRSTFEVPVFKTAASSPDYAPDDSLIEDYAKPNAPDTVFARAAVGRERLAGGQFKYRFGYGRNLAATLSLTIFTIFWTGAIVVMNWVGAPIMFSVIFGLFDILLWWIVIDMAFWNSTFEVDGTGLRGRFGVRGKPAEFSASEIQGLSLKKGMQSGSTVFYELRLRLRDQKPFTLGKGIKGHADAEFIADEIRAILKLEQAGRTPVETSGLDSPPNRETRRQ